MADNFFQTLTSILGDHEALLRQIADRLEQLEIGAGGGGGGNATVADYESGATYKRNTLVVDPNTETMYRVIPESYVAVSITDDTATEKLKLVGYESQFVTFDHPPTQEELNLLPEDSLVAIYSPADDPYTPALSYDNIVDNSNNNT
jgi:hypothetical protein